MAGQDGGKTGAFGAAHTRADPPAAGDGAPAGGDLFADLDDSPVVVPARKLVDGLDSVAVRRGRGRPAGAANLRNAARFELLEAKGHRDPLETLSWLQSLRVDELAAALGCKPIEAAQLQRQAAADLAPYKYAKRTPPPEDMPPQPVPVVQIGVMLTGHSVEAGGFMTIDGQPVQYQGVSTVEPVRQDGDASHDAGKPMKTQGDPA